MYVASWHSTWFCVVLCVGFCTGHFVMVPLSATHLHWLQLSFFEHLFNLYFFLESKYTCFGLQAFSDSKGYPTEITIHEVYLEFTVIAIGFEIEDGTADLKFGKNTQCIQNTLL